MKISTYESLIPQNVAPYKATKIGVYNSSGKRVGGFGLQNLRQYGLGKKLYSFGALSDIHLQYDTAQADFQKALTYLNETEDVEFTCVCGDLTSSGTATELQTYADYVNTYSPDTPVFEITGNHDAHQQTLSFDSMRKYTGHDLYYSFTQGNDVFIMFGMTQANLNETVTTPFSQVSLQWLYETLEANRNKRCFVFQHVLRFDGSGKPYSKNPTGNLLNNTQGSVFCSLMEHYTNVIWFHGHSHTKFDCQVDCDYANYDRMFGCHSIHIPSLATPREYENSNYVDKTAESEGYVVDVYEKYIVLRGRDFVAEKFLPLANYCIGTSFIEVGANTFTDDTGTIVT